MGDLTIPEEVVEALKEVRNDKSEINFVVAGFDESNPKSLSLFGKGNEGSEGIKACLKENDVAYCLLRVDFTYEAVGNISSETTRFIFIYFRPESIPLKRKMMIGSVEGRVKKIFSPFIRTVELDSMEKLTAEFIKDIIDSITMKKDNTTEKKPEAGFFNSGNFVRAETAKSATFNAKMIPDSRASFSFAKGADVAFADEADLAEKLAAVRNDGSAVNWTVFSYVDKKTIGFTAQGNGSFQEMMDSCPDDKVSYGLFRLIENYSTGLNQKIDQVRFGFVVFFPEENISPVLKAVIATHKGFVTSKFRPFHNQFNVRTKDELSNEQVAEAFMALSGVKSNVTEKRQVKKEETYERKFVGGATKEVQKLKFENKDELDSAISAVRDDSQAEIFVLASFVGDKKNLELRFDMVGASIDELVANLDDSKVQYFLVRTSEEVDGYPVTRFSLGRFIGPEVTSTVKATAGVFHGAVIESFGQNHSRNTFATKDEVTAKFSV